MKSARWLSCRTATRLPSSLVLGMLVLLALFAHALPEATVWWRLAIGARNLLTTVVPAVGIAALAGVLLGMLAARVGRVGDRVVTRLLELVGGFPTIIFVALLRALAANASWWMVAGILALVRIPETVRLVRLHAIRFRASEWYVALRALGASPTRVLLCHLLPAIASSLATSVVMGIGVLVGVEAAMAFMGLAAPSGGPCWGAQIGRAAASGTLDDAVIPSIALASTILALYLFAESLHKPGSCVS